MEINGTAKRVYLYLLKKGKPVKLSEIRRDLNLGSSALVKYHVDNLVEKRLVKKVDEGVYEALPPKGFIRLWKVVFPFKGVLASMFVSSLPLEVYLYELSKSAALVFSLILTSIAATYITYEAYKSYEELTRVDNKDGE